MDIVDQCQIEMAGADLWAAQAAAYNRGARKMKELEHPGMRLRRVLEAVSEKMGRPMAHTVLDAEERRVRTGEAETMEMVSAADVFRTLREEGTFSPGVMAELAADVADVLAQAGLKGSLQSATASAEKAENFLLDLRRKQNTRR
jgi:hypothetical protein